MGPPTCVTCGASITDHWFYMSQDWEFCHLGCLLPGEPGHDAGADEWQWVQRAINAEAALMKIREMDPDRCGKVADRWLAHSKKLVQSGHESGHAEGGRPAVKDGKSPSASSALDVETPAEEPFYNAGRMALKAAIVNILTPHYSTGATSGRFRALWLSPSQVADMLIQPIEEAHESAPSARTPVKEAVAHLAGLPFAELRDGFDQLSARERERWRRMLHASYHTEGADDGRD